MSELHATPSSLPRDVAFQATALVPRHIAIIMDGNHRWAKARHLPGAAGHRAGTRNVRVVAEACADSGVEYLTLFALSTENLHRPRREVDLLLSLMRGFLEDNLEDLHRRGVRLLVIGDRSRFPADLQMLMRRGEQLTRDNRRFHLTLAAAYGGRWDIAQAMRHVAAAVARGEIDAASVDEALVSRHLSLGALPSPDLCIRTGGDQRISNFLLWDLAYTELYFTEDFWPDFGEARLSEALETYRSRQRRFGQRV
jgi:undecaprenyl diphosphate synthase